ncbi:hypothetical protein RF11_01094 [Thelohanellus kitauei]|uniref:Uncharacterized protein n=1 Tax=Thelohanellus kitauei TaxID=669202 RepID=A0A0C2ITI4_THEKT|nr:hypothetical protein RF11_01094 [Thelohanellus kitauei]
MLDLSPHYSSLQDNYSHPIGQYNTTVMTAVNISILYLTLLFSSTTFSNSCPVIILKISLPEKLKYHSMLLGCYSSTSRSTLPFKIEKYVSLFCLNFVHNISLP